MATAIAYMTTYQQNIATINGDTCAVSAETCLIGLGSPLGSFEKIIRSGVIRDISIVGPRPSLPREAALYTKRQKQRLLVKPGITCYWQTRLDRDKITFDEWVDLDLCMSRSLSSLKSAQQFYQPKS